MEDPCNQPDGSKTNRARTVALDADTAQILSAWRVRQTENALAVGARPVRDPYVLSHAIDGGTRGGPDGASQCFARLRKAAGVEGVRLHDLRHAHVTMLIADGIPISDVSPRVGHSRT